MVFSVNKMYENNNSKKTEKYQIVAHLEKATDSEIGHLLDQAIKPFGSYQIFIALILCIHSGLVAIHDTIPAFYSWTPEEFYCDDGTQETTFYDNSTCVPGCKKYKFAGTDMGETSIVTEWDLICDRRYLSALSTTIYFTAITLGSLVCGILADVWGRKRVILACLYLQGIFGASVFAANSLTMFIVLRFIQGFFIQGLQSSSFTLMQELAPPNKLTITGIWWGNIWGFGMVILGITAHYIRDWRYLQLATTLPTILTLLWSWSIPESPKWHLTNSDHKMNAVRSGYKLASRNNVDQVFADYQTVYQTDDLTESIQPKGSQVMALFRCKILFKHLVVMCFVFFSVNITYYGMLLFLPSLSGERHLNFILGAVVEIAAYSLVYFALTSRLGRKHTMIVLQYINGAFLLALGVLSLVQTDYEWASSLVVLLALIGKGISSATSLAMFIYGTELFPTIARGSACGIYGTSLRIGSLLAPQVILLGEVTSQVVPLVIMAGLLFLSATVTFTTPETLNKNLPNTLQDVKRVWG